MILIVKERSARQDFVENCRRLENSPTSPKKEHVKQINKKNRAGDLLSPTPPPPQPANLPTWKSEVKCEEDLRNFSFYQRNY